MWYDTHVVLGSEWYQASAPGQPRDHEGEQAHAYSYSEPIQPFYFSLSVQLLVNYKRKSTLYY